MRIFLKVLLIIGILILIITPVLISFLSKKSTSSIRNSERAMQDVSKSLTRSLDSSRFTKDGYIIPLENNALGSIYSTRAQIRGKVKEWTTDAVLLSVGLDQKKVIIPGILRVHCFEKYFRDQQGKNVPSTGIWIDLRNAKNLGIQSESSILPKLLPSGSNVTLLVNVDSQDSMTAYFIGGYGCSIQ